ncbi:YadA-like family protein [Acinetobacter ursingii]|uniref:YadA-like family protein n=2 Tax=Acinetobacter ursingii TaxID=108980 RepID=UPI00148EE327|nr:YadA-like family protein [Acinetobacter ursingii]
MGAWVAVSELAKSKGKSKTVKKIAGSVVVATAAIITVSAHSQDINEDLNVAGKITATGTITGSDVTTDSGASLNDLNSKVNNTTTGLASKASQTDLDNLTTTVNGKASQTDFNNLNNQVNNGTTGLATKASKAEVTAAKTEVVQGKNINVTPTTGSNGQTIYTVKTADDVNFNTLTTTGNTSIGGALTVTGNANLNNGANLNNKKITGLANGTADSDAVNYGQIKNLVIGNNYDGIQYFRTKSTEADASALGEDSTAIGPLATANGDNSIAVGNTSQANGLGSISVGQKSIAYQENNVAIGKESAALGKYSTAIGASTGQPRTPVLTNDSNNNNQLTAIYGIPVTATGSTPDTITEINGTAVTPDQRNAFIALLSSGANLAGGEASLALGTSNLAIGNSSVALGSMNSSSATSSVALGSNNNANGSSSIAIGDRNSASASNAVAIGTQASSSRSNTIAIGKGAIADTSSGIAIGENAGVGSSQSSTTDRVEHIAIGKNSGQNVVGNQNIAIGSGAGSNLSPDNNSSSDSNIAIGIAAGSGINGDDNISIGRNSNTNGGAITRSVTLGSETKSSSQSVVVGNSSKVTSGTDATIVGYNAQVTGTGGIALGANTQAAANNIALGINSDASTNSTTKAYLVSDTIPYVATVGYSVVSVGNGTTTRRITNVAPGGNPTDAVNVSQLTQLHNDVSSILGLTGSTDGKFGEVNVNGTTYGSIIAAIAAGGGGGGTLPTDYYVTYTNQAQNEINLGPNGGKGTTINNVATATNDDQAVNLGQVKALTKDATVKYVSINSIDGANKLSDQAIANNSVAIGPSTGTTAVAENSIALGSNVRTEALNGIAIGNSGTRAKGESSIAIGKENTTADINNIALGTLVSTKGIDSIGIGKNVQTDATSSTTNYAIAIGSDAEVQNSDQAIVIGRKAIVSQDNGVAIGNEALTQGEQGISIGRQATSSAENTTAIGNKASSSGQSANAIGDNAKAQAKDANAMGTAANASALNALALGTGASASSENSTAIGNQARASASDAVALGNGAVSQAQQAIAIGKTATAYAKNAIATGTNANAYAENSIALGSNTTVNNNHANAVALGSNSVSGDYNQTTKSTINGRDYNYAGSGAGLSTVSVGTKDNERQIINVAAGRVTATSTDAVNGSQLFAVQEEVQKPLSFAGDSGTKVDRKLGDQLKVTGGASGTLTEGNIGVVANGSDTLQLKLAKDVNLTNAGSLTVGTTKLTNGKVEIKDASNNSNVSTSTNTVMTAGASSNTIDANSITLKNAANNVVLSGSTGTLTGLTNKTLTVSGFATQGRAATEEQLKLVNDTANKGWNITTNKDTANKSNVAPDATVDFSNSDKNITVSHSGTNVDLKLAEVVNIGGQSGGATISVNGKNGTITGLTNKTFDPNNYTTGRAATEDQLATPLTFTGDNAGVNVQRKLGQQLSIVGGESVAANLTDNNIGVVADSTNNKLTVKLSKDIKLNSVNAAGTVIDSKGLTFVNSSGGAIPNSPSISATGINAGTNKITNVGAGAITDTSMDAVNGSQIKGIIDKGFTVSSNGNTAAKDTIALGENVDFSATDTNIKVTNTGNNQITFGLEPVVKVGPATGGSPVTINGNTGQITGLTNKTTTSSDFATVGRAATEEQLKTIQTGLTDSGFGLKAADSNTVNKKLGETIDIVGADSNITTKVVNGQVAVELSKNIDLSKAGSLTVGNTKVTDGKVELKDGAKSNSSTVDGTVVSDGTNTTTVGASQITVGAGSNPIIINGATGRVSGLTNTTWDPNATYNQKQAATEEQLKSVSDVAQNANKGWKFTSTNKGGVASAAQKIAPDETLDFNNTDGNIKLAATANNLTVNLNPDVNLTSAGSLTVGSSSIKNNEVKVGSNTLTDNGLTVGSTNVTSGNVTGLTNKTTTSSDFATVGRAATEEQLKTIQTGLTDSGFGLKAADSNTVNKKLGETIDIVGADSNITTKVVNGQVAVELSKNIDLSKAGSLTVGNTKVTDGKVELKDGAKSNSSTVDGTVVSDGTNTTTVGASQITVGAGSNPIIINGATGRVSGLTNTTWDPNATYNQKQAATEEQLKSVSDVAQNANKGWKFTSTNKGGVASAAQKIAPDDTLDFNNTDGNIKLAATANNLTVNLNPDVNLTSAGSLTVGSSSIKNNEVKVGSNTLTDNGLTVGSTSVTSGNVTGLTNKTTTSSDFATVGRAATEEQLKTIQTGLTDSGFGLKAADSNTVNKKLGETIDIVGADSNITTKVVNGQVAVELSKNIDLSKTGSLTVGNSKVTDGKVELKDGAKSNSSTVDGTVVSDGTNTTTVGASQITVGAGSNPVIINGATGRVSGLTNTAWDPNATYNQKQAATEEQLKSVSDVAQNANKGWNVKSDSTLASTQVKPEDTVDIGLANDEKNLKVAATNSNGTTTIDFSLSKDLLLDSVNAGGTVIDKSGLRFVDPITGLPLSNTPSISLGGINAGNQIISNVAPGKNGTDAVNVNQLNDVKVIAEEGWVFTTATSGKGQTVNSSLQTIKPNQRFTMISGDNVELIQNGDKVTITTTPEVNFDKVTVGNVVIDKTTNKITGVEAGTVAANSKDVVNGSQLHDLGSGVQNIIGGNTTYDPNTGTYTNNNIGDTGQNNINDAIKSINDTAQNANKGWTVSTNGQNASQVKPTDTVDFANKDGNIKVNNTGNNITVDLAKDIQVDSVTAGDTTVNNNGLTINGGPSVTKNGIDAAGNKVTGVAEGSIAQGSKDAVNGSQIHDIIGDGAFQGGDGNTITNIGGTGATNINDAIGSINQKAGQHSTVEAGQNITVKESTNSNGGKEYTVATADDVKFNSVTSNTVTANNVKVGDVNIDQNGINAGNHKITNVAPGEISSTSKDAVNGSQLNTSNQYIVNSLGGGAKYENGQFTGPTYNVNNGSYNNVGDALGALNQADINLGNRITNLGDRLEQVFYNVNGRIDDVEKKANAGIASAMALEGAPFVAGKFTYAVGAAYHGGENAVGATLRKTADNGRWSITGGVAAASQGDPSVRVGISGVID